MPKGNRPSKRNGKKGRQRKFNGGGGRPAGQPTHLQVQMSPLNQIKQTKQNNQSQIHLALLKKTPNLKVST